MATFDADSKPSCKPSVVWSDPKALLREVKSLADIDRYICPQEGLRIPCRARRTRRASADLLLKILASMQDEDASHLGVRHQQGRALDMQATKRKAEAVAEAQLKRLRSGSDQEASQAHQEIMTALVQAQQKTTLTTQDSKHFLYIVRGCEASAGCVPRKLFEAEPGSLLNRMYNTDWEYATDALGRAHVNSDPLHWPHILNWLSFGALPSEPSPAFVAECKYWQLDRIISSMEQPSSEIPASACRYSEDKSHDITVSPLEQGGRMGFLVEGRIDDFARRFNSNQPILLDFAAYGKSWRLQIGTFSQTFWKQVKLGFPDGTELKRDLPDGDATLTFKPLQPRPGTDAQEATRMEAVQKCPTASSIVECRFVVEEMKRLREYPFVDFHGSIRFVMQYTARAWSFQCPCIAHCTHTIIRMTTTMGHNWLSFAKIYRSCQCGRSHQQAAQPSSTAHGVKEEWMSPTSFSPFSSCKCAR